MPKYKDENGTTRVGDFLRSIGKSDVVKAIVGNLPEKGVLGVFKNFLESDSSLPPKDKEVALKLLEMDLNEMQGVTDRWKSDMVSDSWLSKNTRPLTLIFLTVMMTLFVILDSSENKFIVKSEFIDLLKYLLVTVYAAYFGSRGFEKFTKIKNQ
jgi:AAA+ ATPase superfamily predicted ATPase